MSPKSFRVVFLFSVLLALAAPVAAQTVHLTVIVGLAGDPEHAELFQRWASTLVDGATTRLGIPRDHIIYLSDEPEKDAKKVEKLTPNTQDAGVHLSTPEQKRRLDQRQSEQHEETARRQAELEQLKEALKQAEAARDAGRDPHDGDTTGNARGGTRLNEEYWERQKTLETAVKDARKRLEDAQQGH